MGKEDARVFKYLEKKSAMTAKKNSELSHNNKAVLVAVVVVMVVFNRCRVGNKVNRAKVKLLNSVGTSKQAIDAVRRSMAG